MNQMMIISMSKKSNEKKSHFTIGKYGWNYKEPHNDKYCSQVAANNEESILLIGQIDEPTTNHMMIVTTAKKVPTKKTTSLENTDGIQRTT